MGKRGRGCPHRRFRPTSLWRAVPAEHVVTEPYAPLPEDLPPLARRRAPRRWPKAPSTLHAAGRRARHVLDQRSSASPPPASSSSLQLRTVPKLHAFFSQGRAITACLTLEGRTSTTGRADLSCMRNAQDANGSPFRCTFAAPAAKSLWRGRGRGRDTRPRDLDATDYAGRAAYLYPRPPRSRGRAPPDNWLTDAGNVRGPLRGGGSPQHGPTVPSATGWTRTATTRSMQVAVFSLPCSSAPTAASPMTSARASSTSSLPLARSGRSTATDVLVCEHAGHAAPWTAQGDRLFRQPAGHRAAGGAHEQPAEAAPVSSRPLPRPGRRIPWPQRVERDGTAHLPTRWRPPARCRASAARPAAFARAGAVRARYQKYLSFALLLDLERTHRRLHQNLEDVGLLVGGLRRAGRAGRVRTTCGPTCRCWPTWTPTCATTICYGFLDIMRKRLAVDHPDAAPLSTTFRPDVLDQLTEAALFEEIDYFRPSALATRPTQAPGRPRCTALSIPAPRSWPGPARLGGWTTAPPARLIPEVVQALSAARRALSGAASRQVGRRPVDGALPTCPSCRSPMPSQHWQVCPRCGTVHHFRTLRVCTGTSCDELWEMDLAEQLFPAASTPVAGRGGARPRRGAQRSGAAARSGGQIEERFRDGRRRPERHRLHADDGAGHRHRRPVRRSICATCRPAPPTTPSAPGGPGARGRPR